MLFNEKYQRQRKLFVIFKQNFVPSQILIIIMHKYVKYVAFFTNSHREYLLILTKPCILTTTPPPPNPALSFLVSRSLDVRADRPVVYRLRASHAHLT